MQRRMVSEAIELMHETLHFRSFGEALDEPDGKRSGVTPLVHRLRSVAASRTRWSCRRVSTSAQ